MAQYIPKGWKCSKETASRLLTEMEWIKPLVLKRARRYFALSAISPQDLFQEGMLAATYGLDTFTQGRGKLKAYIGKVVENALAMVACESRAQCRHPYVWEHDGQEWVRVSAPHGGDPEMVLDSVDKAPESMLLSAEAKLAVIRRTVKSRSTVESIRSGLSGPAQQVMDIRLNPPPELLLLARNMTGRPVNPGSRIANRVIARHTGMTVGAVDRAVKEIKHAINAARGHGGEE